MRKFFYTSRILVKYCTKEILCAHRLLKIRGNIGPILFVLYTADAENNRLHGLRTPLLLHKRCTALLLHFRVNGVQPTQTQSIQVWVSIGAPPSGVAVYLTTVGYLRTWWYWSPPSWHHRNFGVHFDSCMTMTVHVSQLVRGCVCQLRQIKTIRKFIPTSAAVILVNNLIILSSGLTTTTA